MQSGLVFNIQKYSVQDGPGIRTTVFLKGCPLCCAWCHNPESLAPRPEILIVESRCAACGECRRACPLAESIPGEDVLPARHASCTQCEACIQACPTGARQVVGRQMTVVEIMEEVLQDRIFYEESGGGVTLSGGEPLLQPRFVQALLEACRERDLHAAVDTCGFGCAEALMTIGRLASLVLYDVKFVDEVRHREYCGVPNRGILENLKALDQLHPCLWIRVPVIPGVNDDRANLEAIARLVASLRHVQQVNLLPYHKTGVLKSLRLGQAPTLEVVGQPTHDDLERAAAPFRKLGITLKFGG